MNRLTAKLFLWAHPRMWYRMWWQARNDTITNSTVILFFYQRNDSTVREPEIAIRVGENFSLQNFKNDITGSIVSYKAVKYNMEAMDGTTNNIRMRSGGNDFLFAQYRFGNYRYVLVSESGTKK